MYDIHFSFLICDQHIETMFSRPNNFLIYNLRIHRRTNAFPSKGKDGFSICAKTVLLELTSDPCFAFIWPPRRSEIVDPHDRKVFSHLSFVRRLFYCKFLLIIYFFFKAFMASLGVHFKNTLPSICRRWRLGYSHPSFINLTKWEKVQLQWYSDADL